MANERFGRFRDRWISPPRQVSGQQLRLVARVSGLGGQWPLAFRPTLKAPGGHLDQTAAAGRAAGQDTVGSGGAWFRLAATEVVVGEGEAQRVVAMHDPTSEIVRSGTRLAVVVGLLGLVSPILVRWRR